MLKSLAFRIPGGRTDTRLRPTNCYKAFRLQVILLSKIISIVAVLLCIFNNPFLLFYNFLQHILIEMCIFFCTFALDCE